MPALEGMVTPGNTVCIPYDEAHMPPTDGTWHRIARILGGKGTTFRYSLTPEGVYRVQCTIPGVDTGKAE